MVIIQAIMYLVSAFIFMYVVLSIDDRIKSTNLKSKRDKELYNDKYKHS